jgi:hypothetical protein
MKHVPTIGLGLADRDPGGTRARGENGEKQSLPLLSVPRQNENTKGWNFHFPQETDCNRPFHFTHFTKAREDSQKVAFPFRRAASGSSGSATSISVPVIVFRSSNSAATRSICGHNSATNLRVRCSSQRT